MMIAATAPKKIRAAAFKFQPFSKKQKQVLTWWMKGSPYHDCDALICDGSVRAGKTVCMSLSFVMWAMETFSNQNFGMSGKTIAALKRNVIIPLRRMLRSRGYRVEEHLTSNSITITRNGHTNEFYLFGGRDERSQDLIQGITLAGMFFDEVAIQPESFVNQATARCSVDGAKFWFNCNPAGPYHWFKLSWLDQAKQKNALHLHFTMDDNLSLSERVKQRYMSMYTGVFFKRYCLGLWVVAEGAIYDMWTDENLFTDDDLPPSLKLKGRRYIACDYGVQNATVFLEIWDDGNTAWVVNEYYHSGRKDGSQRENSQYADDLEKFIGDENFPMYIIVDPSAASFKATLRNRRLRTRDADNDVLDGIRMVQTMMNKRKLRVHKHNCPYTMKEISSYVWDQKAGMRGVEQPIKQDDHCMDALRYFVKTIITTRRLNHSA